ncbi:MAG TPA: hypothetical protein VFO85_04940 [Vicinamibacteria bacterium]|nr:hypothetical protein [Vicinamibacteria bacterium]
MPRPFVLGLLALCCAAPAAEAQPAAPTPGALRQAIQQKGAEAVLMEVYEDDARWQQVLEGIASGSPGWLTVGERLKRVAREQAEELTVAVARALEKQPAHALAVLGEAFDADDVCSLNTLEQSLGPDYNAALRAVERRQKAVAAVRDPRLQAQRDECLAFLQELGREVVRNKTTWFQTTSR